MLFENNGNKISLNGANGMLTWRQPVVFLARHGTPDWNMPGIRYDIPPGPPLVPQGEEEAAKLGKFLKSQSVQLIYASPLVRARRTAEIAAEIAGVQVEVVDAVAEYRREENDAQVFARFNPVFLRAWAEAAQYGPVAIVSHGGPVRVMLENLGGIPDVLWHYRQTVRPSESTAAGSSLACDQRRTTRRMAAGSTIFAARPRSIPAGDRERLANV